MGRNPYDKFLGPEDRAQAAVAQWMQLQHPDVPWLHIPNEGKRSKYERYLISLFGCLKGASDILIFRRMAHYNGLAIELKAKYTTGKKNYPTKSQKDFLNTLHREGWCTAVTWGFDETIEVISQYLRGDVPIIKYPY